MLNRLWVILGTAAFCLFLLFIEHKTSFGLKTQELSVAIKAADPDAKPDLPKVFIITLKDAAGTIVSAQPEDIEQISERLAGRSGRDQVAISTVGSPTTRDATVLVTVPAAVLDETMLARFKDFALERQNPPVGLFYTTPGIDLRGGVEFICSLHKEDGTVVPADDDVIDILKKRLDERGLTEPQVTRLSNGQVDIVIPGGTPADASRTRKVLETSGRLEFRHVIDPYLSNGSRYRYLLVNGRGSAPAVVKNERGLWDINPARDDLKQRNRSEVVLPDKEEPNAFWLCGKVELTGSDVADATQIFQDGQPEVGIEFTALGAAKNYNFTHQAKEEQGPPPTGTGLIAIVYDGVVVSAPIVREPSSNQCSISGITKTEEIKELQTVLRGGALAVTPVVLSERVLGATLGEQTVFRAMLSMGVSFGLIVVFMWLYYRRMGTVANLCLIATSFFVWSILSLFGATITLPGLAGLVLTIGMAVDTNILIFERIREELAENHGLKAAISAGYDRAFWTIVDAHLTTFLTAFVLYLIGTGPVKGFGLTLMIGIVVNLFSGLYIGRLLTDWLSRARSELSMANWVPVLRLRYVEWRWVGYIFSIVTALLGLGWFAFGHFIDHSSFERNFDIDFTGGNAAQLVFDQPKNLEQVKQSLDQAWASDQKQFNLLSPRELRMQPYFASLTGDHRASREWVFRARDEEGGRLEANRNELERQRSDVIGRIEQLRSDHGLKDPDAKALEKGDLKDLDNQIKTLTEAISSRTETFTHELAQAFKGSVGQEGDEVLKAGVSGTTVTLTVAVLEDIDNQKLAGISERLKALGRYDTVAAATSGHTLTVEAVLTSLPDSRPDVDPHDAVAMRLQALLTPSAQPVSAPTTAPAPGAAAAPAPLPPSSLSVGVAEDLYTALTTAAGANSVTVAKPFPSSEHFSGQVAGQMKWRALLAVLISLLAILAYVAARFEFRFGLGAVVALFHDVALTVGLISLLGIRIDLTVIAALLTIIGYSINGTIVTFDRVRENLRKLTMPLTEVIDLSIAQTMPRTILTNSTVILTVLVLWLYGGDALHGFTSTLLIGLLSGAYSSVFVAPPLLLTFTRGAVPTDPDAGAGNGPAAGAQPAITAA